LPFQVTGIPIQQQRLDFLEYRDLSDDKRLFDFNICGGATLILSLYPAWEPLYRDITRGNPSQCMRHLNEAIDNEHAALLLTPSAAKRMASGHASLDKPVHTILGWSALFYAAFRGERNTCGALMEFGVQPSSRQPGRRETVARRPGSRIAVGTSTADGSGRTPLHCAADQGHVSIVAEMIKMGADPSVNDWEGATAEMLAKSAGQYACAEALAIARWDTVQVEGALFTGSEVNDVDVEADPDGRTFSVAFLSTVSLKSPSAPSRSPSPPKGPAQTT
jgi:ankyrin repeat protein